MRIKYFISLLKEIFIENPIKVISLILAIVAFSWAGTFKDMVDNEKIISKIEINNVDYYLYYDDSNDSYKLISESKDVVIKNNTLYIYTYNVLNILLYLFFGLTVLIIFLMTMTGDDEWEFYRCRHDAFTSLVRCEMENGYFIYFIGNKLIEKSQTQLRYGFSISSFSELKRCPVYQTISKKRSEKLKNLGI